MRRGGDLDDAIDVLDVWLTQDQPDHFYETQRPIAGVQTLFAEPEWVADMFEDPAEY